ncbi:MAG: hypothetical protein RLN62_06255 [Rickettsiales bacterium]
MNFKIYYRVLNLVKSLIYNLNNDQLDALNLGVPFEEVTEHDWNSRKVRALRAGASLEEATGHDWTLGQIETLEAGAPVQEAIQYKLMHGQVDALRAGASVQEAIGHDWTWQQARALEFGASLEEATGHDWTLEQARALRAGASIEEATGHDWSELQVEALRACASVKEATEYEWTKIQVEALKVGLSVESAFEHKWTWPQVHALGMGVPLNKAKEDHWTMNKIKALRLGFSTQEVIEHEWTQSEVIKALLYKVPQAIFREAKETSMEALEVGVGTIFYNLLPAFFQANLLNWDWDEIGAFTLGADAQAINSCSEKYDAWDSTIYYLMRMSEHPKNTAILYALEGCKVGPIMVANLLSQPDLIGPYSIARQAIKSGDVSFESVLDAIENHEVEPLSKSQLKEIAKDVNFDLSAAVVQANETTIVGLEPSMENYYVE